MILQLELIKELIKSQNNVVKYERGFTHCPVCRFAGLPPGKILVSCTCKDIRYCSCEVCGATFRAIGDEVKPGAELVEKPTATVKSTAKHDKATTLKHNKSVKRKKGNKRRNKKEVKNE